jgi:FMN phosphatase YigB (HAD superfamily)
MKNINNIPKEITNLASVDFHGVKLVSFDFFDTLVYRDSVSHFRLWKNVSNKYFVARLKSEIMARLANRLRNIPEVGPLDIYNRMPPDWGLEFELDLEIASLNPNPLLVDMVKKAISSGSEVCIISDTHYRASEIERILLELNIPKVKVFTSSDHVKTKSTGLFEQVQSFYNVKYSDWIHIGDNLKSDIGSAQELGINSIYYPHMKFQLINSGLISSKEYKFFRKAGKSGNKVLAEMFRFLLIDKRISTKEQASTPELFGSIIGGLVANVIANEIHRMHQQKIYDLVLYSSRDGWLPFMAHKMTFPDDPVVYFKTSRKLLDDINFEVHAQSIIGSAARVLIYDLGWRGSTARRMTRSFPTISWDFVYWQILGKKSPNQHELNPGGFRNRMRIWRSRDFLESIFTDESNGYDRIGTDLLPKERVVSEDSKYKTPIITGATSGFRLSEYSPTLQEASLILEGFSRFPSDKLITHFDGHRHQVNQKSSSYLVTTSWRKLLGRSRILWTFGSRLPEGNVTEKYLFSRIVLMKEAGQRILNLIGRFRHIN